MHLNEFTLFLAQIMRHYYFFLDLENWGSDYVLACENATTRNEDWWAKYVGQMEKFKQNMMKFAKCPVSS